MVYIVESDKSFYEACFDLEEVILRLGFSLLHGYELAAALGDKDSAFDEEAKVYAIDSQRLTERLLAIDVRLSLALPCRITVYTEDGVTRIGMIRPSIQFSALSPDAGLVRLARELEEKMIQVVDEAR